MENQRDWKTQLTAAIFVVFLSGHYLPIGGHAQKCYRVWKPWPARSAVPEIYFYIQNIITCLFILQMRKYFMQRIEQKWIENWTSLFCGKLDFWRGRLDTAAPCGHSFHNHHITCQLWPLQVTYDRATYGNTPYDQSLQHFLVEVGKIWKHRSISSIIISW